MKKRKVIFGVAALSLFFSVFAFAGDLEPAGPPAPSMKTLDEVEPRTPIHKDDLPLVIKKSGSYYLAESIVYEGEGEGVGDAAIAIESDDVTIDLMGFTLDGNNNTKSSAGIYSDNKHHVTVKNGVVKKFERYGVHLAGEAAYDNSVAKVKARYCNFGIVVGGDSKVTDCQVQFSHDTSISTQHNGTVSGCIVSNSPKYARVGIAVGVSSRVINCGVNIANETGIFASGGSRVSGCSVKGCGKDGINVMDNSIVTGCSVTNCTLATSIRANSECLVENNTVSGCSFGVELGYGSTARNNQLNTCTTGISALYRCLIDNNLIDNTSYGIVAEGHSSIKNNHIVGHKTYGIQINQNYSVIESNTIVTTDPIVTGLEISGDRNLYMNNRLSNKTNINVSGSGNVDGGGNKTF